jgi:hypothetical protein
MPSSNPIGKSDQALATSTSGDIQKSAGPAAIPIVATPGTDYSVPANDETIAGVKTHTGTLAVDLSAGAILKTSHPSLGVAGASCFALDPSTAPPWRVGGSILVDQAGQPDHFVVGFGVNLDGSNRPLDATKVMIRTAQEYNYLNASGVYPHVGAELSAEFHAASIVLPDGSGIDYRPLSIVFGFASKKANANFSVSSLTISDEDASHSKGGYSFDGVTATESRLYNNGTGPAGTIYSYVSTATGDSYQQGRGSVDNNRFYNGTEVWENLQIGGVTKYFRRVTNTLGGDYSLNGPLGQIEYHYTSGGSSFKLVNQRVRVGTNIDQPAQVIISPDAATTPGLLVVGASGQSAVLLDCRTNNNASVLSVSPTAGVTVNGSTPITRHLSATATLDFPSTAPQSSSELTISLTGATVGDAVFLGLPATAIANSCFTARVTAADVVTVRFNNYSAAAVDPASATYRASILK